MSNLWSPTTEDTLNKSAQLGEWQPNGRRELRDSVVTEWRLYGDATGDSLLPTPWSRALQIEEAIKTPEYPSRDQLLDELFGCLAVVGLASIYGLKLDYRDVLQIKKLRKDKSLAVRRFATSLWENRPKSSHSVLEEELSAKEDSLWDSLIVVTIHNGYQSQPIGFLSPNSILCPTTHLRYQIPNVPWGQGRRFCDPTPYLLDLHKQSLANWLFCDVAENIRANIDWSDALYLVLEKFIARLGVKPKSSQIIKKSDPVSGLENTKFHFLAYSATSIKPERNCCRVLLDDKDAENKDKPVILVDSDMPQKLHKAASEIQLYESATLATINNDPKQLSKLYNNIDVVTPKDLFLPKLTLLSGYPALLSSWLPDKLTDRLEMEDGDGATPLLPFSDRLQQLFSSKELKDMVSDLEVDHSKECLVVKLTLRLEGSEEAMSYTLQKSYSLKDANVLSNVPVIAIWPFISDQSWQKYWIFSEMIDGFSINRTKGWEVHIGKFGNRKVNYFSSESFPDLLDITVNQDPGGLIPLESPRSIESTGESWNVGLDFGTSFTNWAVSGDNKAAHTLSLDSVLCLVTNVHDETQHYFLDEYFLPQEMYPKDNNPPTSTSLNIFGYDQNESYNKTPELFHEARLHIPQANEKEKLHIRTGFKWEKRKFQQPFLEQLALMISVHAVQAGVSEMKWTLSYPTAFSDKDKNSYEKLWKNLIEKKLKRVSKQLDHKLRKDRSLLSEALAFAYCLAENKNKPFEHTACMDIGGHTTDISLWQHKKLIYQVSVPFAGQNICTKILDCSHEFASTLLGRRLPSMREIMGRDKEIDRLSIIDNCIRFASKDLLQDELPELRLEKDKKREKFISLMSLGIGGLYYYLGLVVRFLYEENELIKDSCMPVYVGGNGGQLLNWLDPNCQFNQKSKVNKWLSRIQASAINLNNKPNDEGTTLSEKFKDEVALGLVVEQYHLDGEKNHSNLDSKDSNNSKPFSGESLRINQHTFAPKDRIKFNDNNDDEEIKEVELLDLKELQNYVREMVKAMEGLKEDLQIYPAVYPEQLLEGPLKQRVLDRVRDLYGQSLEEGKHETMNDFSAVPGFFLGLRALMVELAEDWAKEL